VARWGEIMIPAGVTLYTWVDVEEVFLRAERESRWPAGLVQADAYWDELTLHVEPGQAQNVRDWVLQEFTPRFVEAESAIRLEEMQPSSPRLLPCRLESAEEHRPSTRPHLSFGRPGGIRTSGTPQGALSPLPEEAAPVVAFHSFKGGVGRTTHAIAFSLRAARRSQRPVLLIDGDFEAPGLTWHVGDSGKISIAYADFLALVHSDPDPDAAGALALTARKLQPQRFGELLVMPAFRTQGQWASLEVPPFLLQDRNPNRPFVLTELLAQLGRQLDVAAVVVDLRAGLSELAAGLMLDPRVARVVVSTLSSQSVRGTEDLLGHLERQAAVQNGRGARNSQSGLIINCIPPDLVGTADLADIKTALLAKGMPYFGISAGTLDDVATDPPLAECQFDQSLITLPGEWGEAVARIEKAGIPDKLGDLVAQILPSRASPTAATSASPSLAERRQALSTFAQRSEYAEFADGADFLRIRAIESLAEDFRSDLPLVVMVGAKGAGKTYTFLQMVRCELWGNFVKAADADRVEPSQQVLWDVATKAITVVGMAPTNLGKEAEARLGSVDGESQRRLGLGMPISRLDVRERARARLHPSIGRETPWLEWWLDVIAWRCGFKVGSLGVADDFVKELAARDLSVVVLFDGLEDLFQNIHSDSTEQEALRSLLQDVPEWLRQATAGRVGTIVFVREDLLRSAVRQNAGQLVAKHKAYQLRWNEEEALRLAAWLASASGALPDLRKSDLQAAGVDTLVNHLRPVWGEKLGPDGSREAVTHKWVLAALGDFRSQIQARDIVRMIGLAAQESLTRGTYTDRLLTPPAMRAALVPCGRKKVEELEQETPALKNVFEKIRRCAEEKRVVPFNEGIFNLKPEEMELLSAQGLATQDGAEWYLAELIRHGLGVGLSARGRPRVLALRRPMA
jgi:septum formation inhibitor-activating ATPase MinD